MSLTAAQVQALTPGEKIIYTDQFGNSGSGAVDFNDSIAGILKIDLEGGGGITFPLANNPDGINALSLPA